MIFVSRATGNSLFEDANPPLAKCLVMFLYRYLKGSDLEFRNAKSRATYITEAFAKKGGKPYNVQSCSAHIADFSVR